MMPNRFTSSRDEAAQLLTHVDPLKAPMNAPAVRDRKPLLLNHEQWAQKEALEYMADRVKANFAGLSDELKTRYIELQRQAVAALQAVESESTRIRDTFKATHLSALKRELKAAMGVDVDPESARIYTRYRAFKESRSPLDVLRGGVPPEPVQTLNPSRERRALDESKYVDRLHSITLWDAACANFGYATDSVLLKPFSYEQASYIRLGQPAGEYPVAPFVEIVRRLDIGSALAATLLREMGDEGALKGLIREASRTTFEFELLEAYRNAATSGIDRTAYTRLLSVLNHEIAADIRPMLMAREPNALIPDYLPTPLVLIKFSGDAGTYSYFPQRLGGAVRYHENGSDAVPHFKRQLIEDHRNNELGWFARQWPLHELAHFQSLLSDEARPKGLNPLAGLLYDGTHAVFPKPSLANLTFFVQVPLSPKPTLLDWLAERQQSRYQANIGRLATTRSAADWQAFKDQAIAIGSEVLVMLTTPMPGGVLGLNRIMQTAIFGSLAYNIVQGVVEASKGNASNFAGALGDTADMIISGFVARWGIKAHRQRMQSLWNRTGKLRKVTREDGSVELWNPDLSTYPHLEADALNALSPTAEGVYEVGGKLYAKVKDGDTVVALEVIRDAQGKTFSLKPRKAGGFKPPVVFDATTSTWRLALDDAQNLSETQLLDRMLPGDAPTKTPTDLQRVLDITGATREDLLNTWQGQSIPGPLADGVLRLQADRLIDQIISDLPLRGEMPLNAEGAVFALLTRLEHWPADTVLDVYNQQGHLTHTYGQDHSAGVMLNHVELTHLDRGGYAARGEVTQPGGAEPLFTLILKQQPPASRLGQLSDRVLSDSGRIALVREQIAGLAKADRTLIFKALTGLEGHKRSDPVASADPASQYLPVFCPPIADSTTPLLAKLHEINPSLSIECLEPLLAAHPFTPYQVSRALGPDNAQPLAFARAVDQLIIRLRVDQALDGIYHTRAYHRDIDLWTREFARGVLNDTLSRDLVITDRSTSEPGRYYDPQGPADPTVELVYYGNDTYKSRSFQSSSLDGSGLGHDQFYLAISARLQPHERTLLGMNAEVDAKGLRQRVGDAMLAKRQPDGRVNLWDTSNAQYERDKTLVYDKVPGELGLYEIGANKYLTLFGSVYQVEFDASRHAWRFKHPSKVGVNSPTLEHNGDGAWRLSSENPLQWAGLTLLRRLRAERGTVSDAVGRQIMDVSHTDEGVLRQVHANNLKPPPVLMDTWKRFKVADEIQTFIEDMQSPHTLSRARSDLQLVLLQSVAGWPWGKVLQIVDKEGVTLKEYGPDLSPGLPRTKITYDDTRNGSFLRALLSQMSEADTRLLLGDYNPSLDARMLALGKKIADKAREHAANVFEVVYDSQERSNNPHVQVVQAKHPTLPKRVIEHVLDYTTAVEQKQFLDAGLVPPRVNEQINWTAREVRLARAYEGLYLEAAATPDSEKLTLHMLPTLAGWPAGIRIEVRQQDLNGAVIDRLGPADSVTTRVLVKHDNRYRAYSQEGVALNPESMTSNNLLSSILHSLDDAECAAIGIKDVSETSVLAQKISEQAIKHRSTIRDLLELPPPKPWQQPPMQRDISFLAYPFTLEYDNSSHSLDLVRQARGLYPGMSYADLIRFLDQLGVDEGSRMAVLATQRAQYEALRVELANWERQDIYPTTGSHVGVSTPAHRQQVRQRIERAWRRESEVARDNHGTALGYTLDFFGLEVGDLPALTGDFSHIGALHMDQMNLHRGSDAFLNGFPGLRRLTMIDNSLTRLPTAISRMPLLMHLNLTNNHLVLTAQSVQQLAGCTQLRRLYLEGNPLGVPPDITGMTRLHELNLRRTGITQWPTGALGLTRLTNLDLRSNQITTIPEAVFDASQPALANRATRLQGNPLSVETHRQLSEYRTRTHINFGVIPVRFHEAGPSAAQDRSQQQGINPWLSADMPQTEKTLKTEQWDLITRPEAGTLHFTNMLKDLAKAQAVMSGVEQNRLKTRVWSLITSALKDTLLREKIMEADYVPTCEDGVMVHFVNREMTVLTHEFEQRVRGSQQESDHFNFARMLFRLEQVDALAGDAIAAIYRQRMIEMDARPVGAGARREAVQPEVDGYEIVLHYRFKLAGALDLPIHTEKPLYASEAQLTAVQVIEIRDQILEKENRPEFRFSLSQQTFWLGYLKTRYAERFAAIEAQYQQDYTALSKEVGLTEDVELQRGAELTEGRDQRINGLIEELTEQAQRASQDQAMDVS